MDRANEVKIKICGLKRACDVRLCGRLGVDIAGLVVEYPLPVPWNLTADEARLLIAEVRAPMRSCIVTGGTRDKILTLAKALNPDYVQLHYRETLTDTEYIARELLDLQIGVIKTLPLSPDERLTQFGTDDIAKCTELLNRAGIYAILVDARSPSNAADTAGARGRRVSEGGPASEGRCAAVDSGLYRQIREHARKPVILAGGITPANIPGVLSSARPDIIDMMTGVEDSPGVKNEAKLARVMGALGRAASSAALL
ncbi:MAG: phosphoribosylanthranilate isomerase [Bacillota bacterium]